MPINNDVYGLDKTADTQLKVSYNDSKLQTRRNAGQSANLNLRNTAAGVMPAADRNQTVTQ